MIEQKDIGNSNELLLGENKINSEILKISIELPKSLVPCVDDVCRITQRKRDDLFTYFVIFGLVGIYEEPERIFNITKKTVDFLERLRNALNQYYGMEYFKNRNPDEIENKRLYNSSNENVTWDPQSNKDLVKEVQIFEFILLIPDVLMKSFNTLCKITNRTREYLSKLFIMDQFAFLYQNPELIYEYIKDFESFVESLRIGINQIFGKNYLRKEQKV